MKRIQWAVSFLALSASGLFAQTTSTTILGTVSDSTGAIVAGAKVTAKNTGTAVSRSDITTATGDFNIPFLEIGSYDITVEMPGFKTETKKNIALQVNDKARVDFQLAVGQASEHVEVTAEAALLKTDESTLGQVVTEKTIQEMPLNGRNIAGLAVLQPGVQFGGRMGFDGVSGSAVGVPIPGIGISLSANGQRDTNQHATLDGVVATEARVNTVPFTPSIEAIQEFRVLSGSYSAEYGTNSGAQVIIVTKSGTNSFHGTAYEFVRNDKFDAENYFTNYFTAPGTTRRAKDGLRQNQFGGVFSGPVILPKIYNGKDKTFFMFDYERRIRKEPGQVGTGNAPSDAFKSGDLSALLNRRDGAGNPLPAVQIVDPLTGAPFANNQIPANRISPAAKGLLPFLPTAQRTNPDPLNGITYIGAGGRTVDDEQRYIRGDHNFSERDKIFGRYAFDDISYNITYGDTPYLKYFVAGRNQNLAGSWLHIFSHNLINEFRYGYMRSVDNTLNSRSNSDFTLDSLGLGNFRVVNDSNRQFTKREAGIPVFNIANFSGSIGQFLGDRDGGNGFDFNQMHQFSDNLTLSSGAHNFKFGFDLQRVALFRGAANVARGDMFFDDAIAKNSFAAFLLGYPIQTDTPEGLPLTDSRQNRFGGYVQDDWKASRRLTLNLGVRYEYNSTATDIDGLWRSLSFKQSVNGIPTLIPNIRTKNAFYTPEKKNFAPRIGIAFRATDKWVVRSGFGIYYNVQQLNNYTILNLNPPLSGSSAFTQTAVNGVLNNTATPLSFGNPFGVVNSTSPISANTLNPDNWQPRVAQWSFDIQRQLPWNMAMTVGYVGSKGSHIDNTVELNNPDPGLSSLPTTPQQRRPWQFIIDGVGGPTRGLTRIRWLDSGANSWYHGLQLSADKRFSKGIQFGFSYTYSKSMGEGYGRNESFGGIGTTYQNPRNRAAEKALYPFDVKHNLVMNYLYELPGPRSGIARSIIGGWQTNGIWTLRGGFPFTVSQGNTLNTINSSARPDILTSPKLDNPSINRWYNTNAFQTVTCQLDYLSNRCKYGNAGQGILRGPSFHNLDFSLFKNFQVRERMRVQFRAEMFNIFNSPNFNLPNASLNASPAYQPALANGVIGTQPLQPVSATGPGTITSLIAPMRVVQFGLKLSF
ncbi:MAG: TonB-dependent receptor [Acidobacteria bacterium]|nr:TonB-dependent receptor [Acidobacteriota bacterium]